MVTNHRTYTLNRKQSVIVGQLKWRDLPSELDAIQGRTYVNVSNAVRVNTAVLIHLADPLRS